MKILLGRQADNRQEATRLAFREAGVEDMSADVIDMFESLTNDQKIAREADKAIGTNIRGRYGNKATWRAERWFVPMTKLHYAGKDMPQLIIEITMYLVAQASVKTQHDSRLVTLVGAIGKPETFSIPMVFLHAFLEKDLDRFAILAKDSVHTTWEVPGANPVRLPNDFINELTIMLKYQSVVAWLGEFGAQGRCIAPLVAGSLLGLAFQDNSRSVLVNKQGFTTDDLVGALESMAFRHGEAKEMVNRAMLRLKADMTLEEAITITLQTGEGGD